MHALLPTVVHAALAQLILLLPACRHLRVITAQVDFLLAAMRTLAAARPDLKLLLMSATLNSANISEYFAGHVPGAWPETKRARAT
jgi:hypothetical protein